MERTLHIDPIGNKEPYIQPALTRHPPLRDLTAFDSDCPDPEKCAAQKEK